MENEERKNEDVESHVGRTQTSSFEPSFKIGKIGKVTTLKLVGKNRGLIQDILLALEPSFMVKTSSDLKYDKATGEYILFAFVDRKAES